MANCAQLAALLANMPSPASTLVHHSLNLFLRTDRGVVRNSNDKTVDNRAARFRDWLATSCGYRNLCCAQRITRDQAIGLLAAYLDHVAATPCNPSGRLPMANTLHHHLTSAHQFLQSIIPEPLSILQETGAKPALLPILNDKISQRRK